MEIEYGYMVGMAITAGIAAALGKKFLDKQNGKYKVEPIVEEELIVDELCVDSIKKWHMKYMQDSGCVSVLVVPKGKYIGLFELLNVKKEDYGNSMIQGIYSEQKEEMLRIRLITYSSMEKNLCKKMVDNDGILILEE